MKTTEKTIIPLIDNNMTPYPLHRLKKSTITDKEGKHWWPADSVARVLGRRGCDHWLNITLEMSEKECRGHFIRKGDEIEEISVFSEEGIYKLILHSQSQKAEEFKKGLAHYVLPRLTRLKRKEK